MMTNMNLENGMKKLRRKDLLDEALEMARGAYEMYGPNDTITVTNLIRLIDKFDEEKYMKTEEWNAVRRYYVKKALGGDVDE